jgi:hypothetical protein
MDANLELLTVTTLLGLHRSEYERMIDAATSVSRRSLLSRGEIVEIVNRRLQRTGSVDDAISSIESCECP